MERLTSRIALILAALALGGCSGTIGAGGGPGSGNTTGAAPGTAGATGAGNTTGGSVTGLGGTTQITGLAGSTGTTPVTVAPGNSGVVVLRRLNQTEYNNTVRDLLQTTLAPATAFPADDLGGEFDTVGSALTLSPAYVRAYESTAHALVADLFAADATRRGRIVTCNVDTAGDTCASTILKAFARKAWRRPVTTEEATGLLGPVTAARTLGATPIEGLRHAMAAVLLSPFFVFKVEIDPDPTSTQSRRISPHELATRMSYALWSSMPDDALSTAADAGQLSTDAELTTHIDRMLADPKSGALLDSFAAEWLQFKDLEAHEVDLKTYPKFTPALARSMRLEARRFIEEFLRMDLPVSQMLNARFSFLDSTLATHYGLSRTGGTAADFVRVDTSASQRIGLLTLGAFLTSTSVPTRSSPVKRGEFIFSRLLCGTIQQPPPDVPPLPEMVTTGTLRDRLEAHRADPACSGCHTIMDPLGFGLENYDGIGAYRTMEGTAPVNATGTLPNGTMFSGAVELGTALSADPRFAECVTRKFMTFAIGRLLNQKDDSAWVSYLANRARPAPEIAGNLRGLIRTVMLSDAFRSRQSVPPP